MPSSVTDLTHVNGKSGEDFFDIKVTIGFLIIIISSIADVKGDSGSITNGQTTSSDCRQGKEMVEKADPYGNFSFKYFVMKKAIKCGFKSCFHCVIA